MNAIQLQSLISEIRSIKRLESFGSNWIQKIDSPEYESKIAVFVKDLRVALKTPIKFIPTGKNESLNLITGILIIEDTKIYSTIDIWGNINPRYTI
jgi:hypothetical protein